MNHDMNLPNEGGGGMVGNVGGWRETENCQGNQDMKTGGFRAHHGTNMRNKQRIFTNFARLQ